MALPPKAGPAPASQAPGPSPQGQGSPDAPDAPGGEEEGSGEKPGSVTDLIMEVDTNLATLNDLVSKAQGVPAGVAEALSTSLSAFRDGVQKMLGKGGSPTPAAGSASMEQGGAKGAVPAM